MVQLRGLGQTAKFLEQRNKLNPGVQQHLKRAINKLRTSNKLPADADVDDFVPPVYQAWQRAIDGTDLWLLYTLEENGSVILRAIRDHVRGAY
ncbi:MAG: hypothetical protein H6718_37060 [Polyangiaceae bacterium]|nr:hypothetical protein [Polyangiaceae bacterium]